MKRLVIPGSILAQLEAHAHQEAPRECCGLLGGCDSLAGTVHALRNESPSPERAYFAAPAELFRAMRQIRRAGESLLAIYHSHPCGPAFPSATDVSMAFYPDVVYLVISLAEPETRAFSITNGVVETADLVVAG